jgi:hypothetical protein
MRVIGSFAIVYKVCIAVSFEIKVLEVAQKSADNRNF